MTLVRHFGREMDVLRPNCGGRPRQELQQQQQLRELQLQPQLQPQPFRLFDLPAEIRARVYDLLFSSSLIHVHVRDGFCRPYCQAGRLHWAVCLMLTSRQVYHDSVAFFNRAIFVFTVPGLHGDPWLTVVPKSLTRSMRRVAAKMGVGEQMLELLDDRILDYFPVLEDLRIWIFFTSRDNDRIEELKNIIHARRSFRLSLCIRRSIYSRQRFTVSIDHEKNVSVFERHPMANNEVISSFLEPFGLGSENIRYNVAPVDALTSFWDSLP